MEQDIDHDHHQPAKKDLFAFATSALQIPIAFLNKLPFGHMNPLRALRAGNRLVLIPFLLLILGAIALVLVIIGFSSGWDFLTRWFGDVKPEITVIEKTCNGYILFGGSGYCTNSIDFGKDNYVNCDYARSLGAKFEDPEKAPTCDSNVVQQICEGIKLREGDNFKPSEVQVNGQPCA